MHEGHEQMPPCNYLMFMAATGQPAVVPGHGRGCRRVARSRFWLEGVGP